MRADLRRTLLFVAALAAVLVAVALLVGTGGVDAGVATPLVVLALVVGFFNARRFRRPRG